MKDEKLETLLEQIGSDLDRWHQQSGGIFYSGRSTLVEGDFYLMGLNPGGNPQKIKGTIDESLKQWKDEKDSTWSAYLDENWLTDDKDEEKKGKARHQLRVRDFCKN